MIYANVDINIVWSFPISWYALPDLNRARWHGTATWIPQYGLLILGGFNDMLKMENSVELLRISETGFYDEWCHISPVLQPSSCFLIGHINDHVFVLGANSSPLCFQMLNLKDYPNEEWTYITYNIPFHLSFQALSMTAQNDSLLLSGLSFFFNLSIKFCDTFVSYCLNTWNAIA